MYVTHGNRQEAGWTLDYAKQIRLIGVERKDTSIDSGNYIYLLPHKFVGQLDRREKRVCQALYEMVNLMQRNKSNWIDRYIIVNSMDNDPQFGFSRSEHEYWLDQTIFRMKLLEQKRERVDGNFKYLVRVKE